MSTKTIIGTICPNEVNQLLIMDENDIRNRIHYGNINWHIHSDPEESLNDIANSGKMYRRMIASIEYDRHQLLY